MNFGEYLLLYGQKSLFLLSAYVLNGSCQSRSVMSASVNYVSCLRDAVYQDSSSVTLLFYKKLSTVCCLTLLHRVNCAFIHSVFCLTTGPKPPPKRCLHTVPSRASSFKWEYPLLSLRPSSSFLPKNWFIHSFIQYSVWRQVQSLLQNDSSTQCDLELPPSNESILSCP